MNERLALLKDYCTAFQPYHQTQPAPCTIEEEYELRKAAEEMAKALTVASEIFDLYGPGMFRGPCERAIRSSLAAWNALK